MTKLWNIVYLFVLFNSDIAFPLVLSNLADDLVDSIEEDDDGEDGETDSMLTSDRIKVETRPG